MFWLVMKLIKTLGNFKKVYFWILNIFILSIKLSVKILSSFINSYNCIKKLKQWNSLTDTTYNFKSIVAQLKTRNFFLKWVCRLCKHKTPFKNTFFVNFATFENVSDFYRQFAKRIFFPPQMICQVTHFTNIDRKSIHTICLKHPFAMNVLAARHFSL